jgi:hypothetical protein
VVWQNGLAAWCAEKYMRATVSVPPVTQIPIVNFSASPTSFSTGGGVVTFKWTTQYATFVGIEGMNLGFLATNDSLQFLVKSSQTFTMTATNDYGMVRKSITISVMTPPPPVGFVVGGRVAVTANALNVRSAPSLGNTPLGIVMKDMQGTLLLGPIVSGDTWWKIQWDNGKLGYSSQLYLTVILPQTYPSVADKYDTVTISSQGDIDPIILYSFHIRKGCADTTMSLPQLYFVVSNPVGIDDTTYFIGTYHFTKPKASVER